MLKRSQKALKEGVEASTHDAIFLESHPNYVSDYMSNLVAGIKPSMFEGDLRQGSGSELDRRGKSPPKFAAVHSSAALAVNCFAPFKEHISDLRLLGKGGFKSIDFEYQCPIWKGNPQLTPPNLDALAKTDGGIVGIESKCTEFLRPKKAEFAPRYEDVVEGLLDRPWLQTYLALKANPKLFKALDAAQLVKHCLGLRNTFPNRNITLVYVFWEPENAPDFDIFKNHRTEVTEFTGMVAESIVKFATFSYLELWDDWALESDSRWILEHVKALRLRYAVTV